MSKTPIEITPTEITDKVLQENTRLTERANDLERIMNLVKDENVALKKELVRIELLRAELVKETDTIEVVYDADLPVDVKKVVKKRAPKKKVVKEMVLVDSVDVVPVIVNDECVCVATDESKYAHMKKHENDGVKPIMDHIV